MIETPKHIKRLEKIINILEEKNKVNITQLAKDLNVSEMTIYNDLNKIKNDFNIIITKKEVIYTEEYRLYDYPHYNRLNKNIEEKKLIAKKASNYIFEYDTFFLGGSTTCYYLAKEIIKKNITNLTIITISPIISLELAKNKNIEILCTGGRLNKAQYLYFEGLDKLLKNINLNKAFISCVGIDEKKGFTELIKEEAEFKSTLSNYCNQIYILIDHSKFNKIGTYSFGTLKFAKKIFIDDRVDKKILKTLQNSGLEII